MLRFDLHLPRGAGRCPGVVWWLVIGLSLSACTNYRQQVYGIRDGLLQGRPGLSLSVLEARQKDSSGDVRDVLTLLDSGMIRRINGQYAASNRDFEAAKYLMETYAATSITENIGALTINEGVRSYVGDTYEQLLLHAFMALNDIEMGDFDAARVEMLQADVKMQTRETQPEDGFVRYLSGMIFEKLGEPDQAMVAYRKASLAFQQQADDQAMAVPTVLQQDLLRLAGELGLKDEYRLFQQVFSPAGPARTPAAGEGEAIVILLQGLAPVRSENVVPVYASEIQKTLRIAFPAYPEGRQSLPAATVRFDDGRQASLETVEDIDRLARRSLDDAMPGIMARAMSRAVIKYNSQHTANDNSPLAGLLLTVTNLLTEQADTRSWATLPQEIRLYRQFMSAGVHAMTIDLHDSAGHRIERLSRRVTIRQADRTFVVIHWFAPGAGDTGVAPDTRLPR